MVSQFHTQLSYPLSVEISYCKVEVPSPSQKSQKDETVGECVDGCVQGVESMESHHREPILGELDESMLNLLIALVTCIKHNSPEEKEANKVFQGN